MKTHIERRRKRRKTPFRFRATRTCYRNGVIHFPAPDDDVTAIEQEQGDEIRMVQRILADMGYLTAECSGSYDPSTGEAVRSYQRVYGLPATGILNVATLLQLEQPRCGVPDIPAEGGSPAFPDASVSSGEPSTYPTNDLSYAIVKYTEDIDREEQEGIIADAFGCWARHTPLTFRRVHPEETPTFSIAWKTGNHGDGNAFDRAGSIAAGNMIAHAFYPPPRGGPFAGQLHFDDTERWFGDTPRAGARGLRNVALHEIGHLLGLGHSDDRRTVMHRHAIFGASRYGLHKGDIDQIQALYPMTA